MTKLNEIQQFQIILMLYLPLVEVISNAGNEKVQHTR